MEIEKLTDDLIKSFEIDFEYQDIIKDMKCDLCGRLFTKTQIIVVKNKRKLHRFIGEIKCVDCKKNNKEYGRYDQAHSKI